MNDYSQDTLVLLTRLGWETANYWNEKCGETSTLGREACSEMVLVLRPATTSTQHHISPIAIWMEQLRASASRE